VNLIRSLLLAAFFVPLWLAAGLAHDEPVKTSAEKSEREESRLQMQRLGVSFQEMWIVSSDDADHSHDSVLYVRNRFDRSGNLTEQWVFDKDDSTLSLSFYAPDNCWLEEALYSDGRILDRTVFAYNEQGLVRQILSLDSTGALTERLDYSDRGTADTVFLEKHDAKSKLLYSVYYAYEPGSAKKHLIETRQANPDGSLKARAVNRFTGDLRTEKSVYDTKNALTHAFHYVYSAAGKFDKILKRSASGEVVSSQSFLYGDDGLLSRTVEGDSNDKVTRTICYVYRKYPQ